LSVKTKRAPSRAPTVSMRRVSMDCAVSGNSRSAVICGPRSASASKVPKRRRKLLRVTAKQKAEIRRAGKAYHAGTAWVLCTLVQRGNRAGYLRAGRCALLHGLARRGGRELTRARMVLRPTQDLQACGRGASACSPSWAIFMPPPRGWGVVDSGRPLFVKQARNGRKRKSTSQAWSPASTRAMISAEYRGSSLRSECKKTAALVMKKKRPTSC